MGGDVRYVLAAKVKVTGPFPVGKGFKVYKAKSPFGKTFLVDTKTLGICGESLTQVKEDIKTATMADCKLSQKQAADYYKSHDIVVKEPGYFWAKMM